MSKFTFRLATLLRLREATRDERRGELAEAYRVDDTLKHQLQRTDAELAALQTQYRQTLAPGEVDVNRLVEAQRNELVLRSQRRRSSVSGKRCRARSSAGASSWPRRTARSACWKSSATSRPPSTARRRNAAR